MTRFYTGIGSRQTPASVQRTMTLIGRELSFHNMILRSGGADGADAAFEEGADPGKKEIFLPWFRFNNHPSPLCHLSTEAYIVARQFHPAYDRLSDGAKKLMARNSYQVLGETLDKPSAFVICWTPGGKGGGGTGQALRIAHHYGIPIFDLGGMPLIQVQQGVGEILGRMAA